MSKMKWRLTENDILRNNNFAIRIKTFVTFMIEIITQKSTLSELELKLVFVIWTNVRKIGATKYF